MLNTLSIDTTILNDDITQNLLILDETKIRKGKPIGLPYIGSKKKISKKIVEIIKQNYGTDKPVYDLFGGGGAITSELFLNNFEVHYNDLDKTVVDMFREVITQDHDWIKSLIISREEFMEIREKENKTTDDHVKLLVNSFGNDRSSYMYSKETSAIKYNLAKLIIDKHNKFDGYKHTLEYKQALNDIANSKIERLEQLERLNQVECLQQLERLQQAFKDNHNSQELLNTITNKDYTYFSDIKNSILYLDPPYENAKEYVINKGKFSKFNSQAFYDWAYNMQVNNNNIVIISSYTITDNKNRFKVGYEFEKVKSTMSAKGFGTKTEQLFIVK